MHDTAIVILFLRLSHSELNRVLEIDFVCELHAPHAHIVRGGAAPPEQRPGVVGGVAPDEGALR